MANVQQLRLVISQREFALPQSSFILLLQRSRLPFRLLGFLLNPASHKLLRTATLAGRVTMHAMNITAQKVVFSVSIGGVLSSFVVG